MTLIFITWLAIAAIFLIIYQPTGRGGMNQLLKWTFSAAAFGVVNDLLSQVLGSFTFALIILTFSLFLLILNIMVSKLTFWLVTRLR